MANGIIGRQDEAIGRRNRKKFQKVFVYFYVSAVAAQFMRNFSSAPDVLVDNMNAVGHDLRSPTKHGFVFREFPPYVVNPPSLGYNYVRMIPYTHVGEIVRREGMNLAPPARWLHRAGLRLTASSKANDFSLLVIKLI